MEEEEFDELLGKIMGKLKDSEEAHADVVERNQNLEIKFKKFCDDNGIKESLAIVIDSKTGKNYPMCTTREKVIVFGLHALLNKALKPEYE